MTYQTIFFDLDGTLIDPKFGITKSVQYALSQYNIKEDLDALTPFIGPPLSQSLKKYYQFNDEQIEDATTHYRNYFAKHGIQEAIPYNGTLELLKKLQAKNKTMYVVTSKLDSFAEALVGRHNLTPYFKKIIGANPHNAIGDKKSLIREALALLPHEDKESIVMIGDTKHDIIGANENGIDSIAVTYGYGSEEELRNSSPTYFVDTIEELERYL